MDNNFTVHAALVSAIAAIFAPAITALIHSVKEYLIQQNSSIIATKIGLIKKFTDLYIDCPNDTNHAGYCISFYQTCMELIPLCKWKRSRKKLIKIGNYVRSNGADKISDKMYNDCIFQLSREV
jgi:hypothetical protein|nr:MAG TPA: hypothetical protein [Caudoviricetes sp.]